ncbi:peroxisomal biogenesis factor 5 isoform 1 [Reticulomyxa filosa]|uniref:Peroxisomal biogenesis factor 5 isoform 1 n=1 Tax=Reticulomyxa filosa TaxID=46433 RepID=X6MTW0_RETFI|nr:peroxisomal biogenesis factor 5 isoform 1 [Reticulomyxa filosa]|eukprot:ETO17383.1 peroxisomal biogenesis factor 5 isoform 1 [Reticulomyxa filosa]
MTNNSNSWQSQELDEILGMLPSWTSEIDEIELKQRYGCFHKKAKRHAEATEDEEEVKRSKLDSASPFTERDSTKENQNHIAGVNKDSPPEANDVIVLSFSFFIYITHINANFLVGGFEKDFPFGIYVDYLFDPTNPYLQHDIIAENGERVDHKASEDLKTKGLHLMREGNLSEAVLAFEASLLNNLKQSDVWKYLGQCHNDNESETNAITAFTRRQQKKYPFLYTYTYMYIYIKCLMLDPSNREALLDLAVSYSNEGDSRQARKLFEKWIFGHPDYSVIAKQHKPVFPNMAISADFEAAVHRNMTAMFLKAVEINFLDPDLHIILGVLYCCSNRFEAAKLHFKRALQERPKDASLWNKLGATQANDNEFDSALKSYKNALKLKPKYTRVLANSGICFFNQGLYQEACQNFCFSKMYVELQKRLICKLQYHEIKLRKENGKSKTKE